MSGAQRLVDASRELSAARSMEQVQDIVRHAARELAGADGATFVIREGNECVYVDEDAVGPLWKGRRFHLSDCISGWCMHNGKTAVIADIYADERIPRDAYRETFVKSLVMVPIHRTEALGAVGVYWAHQHLAGEDEVREIEALADSATVAIIRLRGELPRTSSDARTALAAERCRNLYKFIRLRLGAEVSDRELARRWDMNWRSFLNLKEGSRRVPRLEELETLAELLRVDPALVVLVARGEPADVVNRWLMDGDGAIREGLLACLGLSAPTGEGPVLHSRIDRIPGGLMTMDLRGGIHDCNGRLASLVGEPENLGVGAHFINFVAPQHAASFLKLQALALEKGEAGPERIGLERGTTVDVSLVSVEDTHGRTIGFQALLSPTAGH